MIPVSSPVFNGNEKKYLEECITSGWISSEGPFVERFEKKIAEITGRKFGAAVSNGTGALEIAVKALDLGPGDEVIVPSFSIVSCAAAIVKAGATPVLVDCDLKTFNMNAREVSQKITPHTKAIMVVHTYGLPCDLDEILMLAKNHKLKVIEDAAEVIGQSYKGKMCGGFGDVSIFSFYANKIVSCGEGGMILSNDEKIIDRCRSLRNLCFIPGRRFVHEELGWNYRMTNLQAAVGLAQAEKLSENVLKKRQMGKSYQTELAGFTKIRSPIGKTEYAENIFWVYPVVISEEASQTADEVITALKAQGVDARPFFYPAHLQPVFQKMGLFKGETYPNSEFLARKGFYLPSGVGLSESDIKNVCRALKTVLK
ncbi:MAG: DegT/DnrJ/EryC1/StrS family aminotransferase [Bacteriovoracaceae bacterium]